MRRVQNWRVLFFAWMLSVPTFAQNDYVTGFTPSPHFIVEIEQPLKARAVKGIIRRKQGDEAALSGVLFQVRGPGDDRTVRSVLTDAKGRFRIRGLKAGSYIFKATLEGFQSVAGTIVVVKNGSSKDIEIRMPVGV